LLIDEEDNDPFYISTRVEISKMANKVYSKPIYYFIVLSMICYLYIGLTSNAMIAGRSLKSILSKTLDQELPETTYYLIVSIFFLSVVSLALYNINHLKKLSMFVMVLRFIMIFLIMGSCIYSIVHYGGANISQIPKFELKNITVIIGNSLFLFMSHHSMPGMVENFKPQKNLIKLLVTAYMCSLILMLIYGYVSLFAFGHILECSTDIFPCAIQVNIE
jgi:amino acid permease